MTISMVQKPVEPLPESTTTYIPFVSISHLILCKHCLPYTLCQNTIDISAQQNISHEYEPEA